MEQISVLLNKEIMGNLHNLLNNINDILKKECIKKEESLLRGERFNIFEICGVDHFEVMHSKIISSFLNPKASHGQKEKFLRMFLDLNNFGSVHIYIYIYFKI